MKPEIKQRIEQINSGNVPNGYKKTKVGIVPADWAVIKLSEVLRKQTTKNTNNAIHNVLTNSATQGIVNQTDFFDKQIANDDNTSGYYVVNNGCFVYNPRISSSAPCGPFNRYNGQESGIMSPLYVVYDFVGESQAYSDYLSLYFASSKWHSYMNSIANYGARSDRMNVTSESMNNMPLPFSPLPEQEKIAEILTAQERVIELYEKKIEQLKKLKKVFLQKMFPKPGYSVPEWRFPGFTDAWEQRKLSSLCDKFTDGDWIESKDQSESGVRLVQTGNVGVAEYLDKPNNRKWISGETFDRLHCEEVLPGDILISRLPEPAGRACIMPFLGAKMITAVDCTIVRTSADVSNKFLVQYLSSQDYFDAVNTCIAGGTRQRISRSNLAEIDVPIPTEKAEQDAIGDLFIGLDDLITLHQRKCDEEKQKKKAMVQLLLTGIVRI